MDPRLQALFGLLPLVAFYVLEDRVGLSGAVAAAMAFAVLELAWHRYAHGRWNRVVAFSAGLILVLGGLSLVGDDERFVLWTPVVGDLVFAAVIAGAELRGTSLVIAALREQDPETDLHPEQERFLRGLAWRFALNLTAHAALTAWSTGGSRELWLFVSGPAQYLMMGAQIAGEIGWTRFVLHPRLDALEAAERDEALRVSEIS